MTLKVSPVQFESVELHLGTAMDCKNTKAATAKLRAELQDAIEDELADMGERMREVFRQQGEGNRA